MPAKIIDTYTRDDGHIINVYESGAEYDTTDKKLIKPAAHTVITAENTTDYNRRRQELVRAAFVAGAIEATDEKFPDLVAAGDLRHVHALGLVTQKKGMNEKDPKQTDAARLVLNVGERISETKTIESTSTRVNVLVIPDEVARFLVELKKRLGTETGISESNKLRVVDADLLPPTVDAGGSQ